MIEWSTSARVVHEEARRKGKGEAESVARERVEKPQVAKFDFFRVNVAARAKVTSLQQQGRRLWTDDWGSATSERDPTTSPCCSRFTNYFKIRFRPDLHSSRPAQLMMKP